MALVTGELLKGCHICELPDEPVIERMEWIMSTEKGTAMYRHLVEHVAIAQRSARQLSP